MNDPFGRLVELAPPVDLAAARTTFAQRRRGARRRRGLTVGAAIVGLFATAVGAVAWLRGPTSSSITAPTAVTPTSTLATANDSTAPTSGPAPSTAAHPASPVIAAEPGQLELLALIPAGVVTLDDGCIRLRTGSTFPVIVWPPGSSWDVAKRQVVLPNGDRVDIGATIEGGGGYVTPSRLAQMMPSLTDPLASCHPDEIVLLHEVINPATPTASPSPISPPTT